MQSPLRTLCGGKVTKDRVGQGTTALAHHPEDNGIIFLVTERFTMAIQNIDQLLKRADKPMPSKRLLLASRLVQGIRNEMPARKKCAANGVM